MGKLIHACTILPTSKALLNPLYRAMARRPTIIGLGRQSEIRAALLDLKTMIKSIADRPTHVFELVERPPQSMGMVDASSTGVGGIWILPHWPPIVYRHQWPGPIHKTYTKTKPLPTVTWKWQASWWHGWSSNLVCPFITTPPWSTPTTPRR